MAPTPAFALALPLPCIPPSPHRRRRRFRRPPQCTITLPSTYVELRAQATTSVQAALTAGLPLLEVQFPAVPNMATAALNELLDANRSFVRDFLLAFTPRYPRGSVIAVFPDVGEARLAAKAYGDVPFSVGAIPKDASARPAYVQGEGVVAVVNPGFNVSEWINMEALRGGKPLVAVNADLDKVRGGYYPRIFYPGLHKVKTRFLSKFEEVYYVKQFSNGGTLIRAFPDPWILFYLGGGESEVVWSGEERPEFAFVERLLSERRMKDLSKRG